MTSMAIKTFAAVMTNWQSVITLLALLLLLLANPLQAAPGGGKGCGKDGGGIGGSGVQPELHFQWHVQLDGPYLKRSPGDRLGRVLPRLHGHI